MDEKTPITVFETAAFNRSATPPDDAMVAERVAVERWAGIDVGGRRKGFDLAVLDADSLVELRRSVRDPRAVLELLLTHSPAVVGVDSPAGPAPPGAHLRSDELALARAVCAIRWTPDRATLEAGSDYYDWVRRGLALHSLLGEHLDAEVVEVFPTASWTRWLGPRRGSRAAWTTAGLERLGLAGTPARTNQDVRDAIAAAATAREHGRGRSEAFGEIVVARRRAGLSANAGASDRVSEDLDHLLGRLGDGHRCPVDLLERVGEVGVVQGDQRLAERGGVAGLERRVPLAVLVAEADDDDIGAAEQGLGADSVDASPLAVLPEALRLCAEDLDPNVVGRGVVGDWGEQLDREPGLMRSLGDPLAPIGVDLARQVDGPGVGAVGGHRSDLSHDGPDALSR